MKTLVFIKQIPDTADVRIDPTTGNLCRDGVKSILNPCDANAIEAALRIKKEQGGTVVAITMGPPQADEVLRRALAMGCDDAVLISDRALGGADTRATGYPLAMAARKLGDFDLILCGRHAADAETAQTGPVIAAFLDIPQVTLVDSIQIEDGWAICTRSLPDRRERVKVRMPALLTVCREINEPRYPTPLGIMKATKKARTVWNAADLELDDKQIGIKGSPSVNLKVFAPEGLNKNTVYFDGTAEEMAVAIADALQVAHII